MSVVSMDDEFSLATSFFEIPHHRLKQLLSWPMDSYVEKHPNRKGNVFKLSLVAIAGGDATSSGSGENAVWREKARELIESLYLDLFSENEDDRIGINCATANGTSFALFVSCGVPPPKKKLTKKNKKLPKTTQPVVSGTSIFALQAKKGTPNSLQCIAAVTVTTGQQFQFVHWLGVTDEKSVHSKYSSWRRRGLASLLLQFVSKHASLPSILGPQVIVLQCTPPKPPSSLPTFDETKPKSDDSPAYFYLKLGGNIPPLAVDNGWSTVESDPVLATTMTKWPILWVPAKEHDMLLVTLLGRRLPVPCIPIRASKTTLDSCYAWFPIEGARVDDVLDLHEHDLYIFSDCTSDGTDQDYSERYHSIYDSDNTGGLIDIAWREAYDVDNPNTQRLQAKAMHMLLAWVFRSRLQFQGRVLLIATEAVTAIQLLFQEYIAILAMEPTSQERVNALTKWNSALVRGGNSVVGYVMQHLDMFTMSCIVFVCDEGEGRWTFTVAMNAGAGINAPCAPRNVVSGYHYVDSTGSEDATGIELLPKENGFRWFLNVAWMLISDPNNPSLDMLNTSLDMLDTVPYFQCPLQVDVFGSVGHVPEFNRLVFKAPSIFVQPGSIENSSLGCILNLSRLVHVWPRCDWSPEQRGLLINEHDGLIVMDPRVYGLTNGWTVCDPPYAIEGMRREFEVYMDRLADLAHKHAPKAKAKRIGQLKTSLPTPVFKVHKELYERIAFHDAFPNVVDIAREKVSGKSDSGRPPKRDDNERKESGTGADGNENRMKDDTGGAIDGDKTKEGDADKDKAKEGDGDKNMAKEGDGDKEKTMADDVNDDKTKADKVDEAKAKVDDDKPTNCAAGDEDTLGHANPKEGDDDDDGEREWQDVDDHGNENVTKGKKPVVEATGTPEEKDKSVAANGNQEGNATTPKETTEPAIVTQEEVGEKPVMRRSARNALQKKKPQLPKATPGTSTPAKASQAGAQRKQKPGSRASAIIRTRGKKGASNDGDDTNEEKVILDCLAKYHCADRSSCLLGMQQAMRPGIDTKCRECDLPLHIVCGYVCQVPTSKTTKKLVKRNSKMRNCYYCEKDEERSDDEVELPVKGAVSNTVAQQRRDRLSGKKGIERMMAARHDSEDFVVFDNDQAHMTHFINCQFRRWNWKTISQFEKWVEDMDVIVKQAHNEYLQCEKKTKGIAGTATKLKWDGYVATKLHVKEEKQHYQHAVTGLTREWLLMCDGAVRGMRYSEEKAIFNCHVRYVSKRRGNKIFTMKVEVDEDWMLAYYGKEVTEYVKVASRKAFDGFVAVLQKNKFLKNTEGKEVPVDGIRFLIEDKSWEGKCNDTQKVHQFADDVIPEEVKLFYFDMKTKNDYADTSFVAIGKDMEGPTVPIEDSAPVVSVKFVPSRDQKKVRKTYVGTSFWDVSVEKGVVDAYKELAKPMPGDAVKQAQQGKTTKKKKQDDGDSDDNDYSTGDAKYKIVTTPEIWWAKLSDGHEKVVTKEELVALFGSKFVAEAVARGKSYSTTTKYIDVPVGAVREARLSSSSTLTVAGAPIVFHQQGTLDTCVFSSMASALYFAGAKQAASFVQNAGKAHSGANAQGLFTELIRVIDKTHVGFLEKHKLPPAFDWKNDLKSNMIFVGSLEGSDGSVHHAVTLFRGWIFDSNEKHAMPLCKEGLDFCTQTNEEMIESGCGSSTFCGFKHGLLFVDTTKKQKLQVIESMKPPKKKRKHHRRHQD